MKRKFRNNNLQKILSGFENAIILKKSCTYLKNAVTEKWRYLPKMRNWNVSWLHIENASWLEKSLVEMSNINRASHITLIK